MSKEQNLNKTFIFQEKDKIITIGRMNCNVEINHTFLSKKQCTIEYDPFFKFWKLTDGFETKKSTHGTWLLIDSRFELTNSTQIRVGNNVVKLNFANSSFEW